MDVALFCAEETDLRVHEVKACKQQRRSASNKIMIFHVAIFLLRFKICAVLGIPVCVTCRAYMLLIKLISMEMIC